MKKKIEYLKKQFAKTGIKARFSSAKWDYVQAILSRGSRELTPYLIEVYKNGANLGAFKQIYKDFYNKGMLPDSDEFGLKELSPEKELPWDFIEYPKSKEFLISEYKRLLALR